MNMKRPMVKRYSGVALVVLVLAACAGSATGRVPFPQASIPTEGGVVFAPPRVEGADTVDFPITLLNGRGVVLTLPRSLADEIQGLVPGGAASWELDPCCGRTLDVTYGSVEGIYGDRRADHIYTDVDGNEVGFFTEEDDVDYLVFQYGSWVVRAWDGDPAGQRFTEDNRERFASLMRGYETTEGFLVLEPAEPMSIGPTDAPDATLTSTGEGSVGVFISRECASEGPSANPDLVTSKGYLVSFAEESRMTSICFPENSLYLWVSRLDLTQDELETIDLVYQPDNPGEPPPSTTTLPATTSTASAQINVGTIPLDEPIPLRVLAVRPNNPSLAVLDFDEGTTMVYPPGVHALPLDAKDGAVATSDGDWIIWTNGVARLFTGSLDHVDLVLGPDPPRQIEGLAPALRAVPTPDGTSVWLVQPGLTWGDYDYPTLVERVRIADGATLLTTETDGSAFPVAATDTGLVLNTHRWFDTGDGWTDEPGSEATIHLGEDGTITHVGAGRAIAASPTRVVRIAADRLLISNPDGSDAFFVVKPFEGTWMAVGGPGIPSDAMPFQTVSPDGTEVLVSLRDPVDGLATYSEFIAVDLSDGTTRTIAQFDSHTSIATWSSDGQWIALIRQQDITFINSSDTEQVIPLEGVIPTDHWAFAAR